MLPGRNLAIMFALIFIFAQFAKGGMNQYEQSDDFVYQSGFNFAIMPFQVVELLMYSHLSNKRDVRLTDFGKFHPAQN